MLVMQTHLNKTLPKYLKVIIDFNFYLLYIVRRVL